MHSQENVTKHPLPPSTKGRRISLSIPHPQSSKASELMPGRSQIIIQRCPTPCFLAAEKKPFLSTSKEHIRKASFGVLGGRVPLPPAELLSHTCSVCLEPKAQGHKPRACPLCAPFSPRPRPHPMTWYKHPFLSDIQEESSGSCDCDPNPVTH